jgi:hypothetical protein
MTTLTAPTIESCKSGAYAQATTEGLPRRRKTQGNAHQDITRDHLTATEVKLLTGLRQKTIRKQPQTQVAQGIYTKH